jgi:hypothetical protein
VIPVILLYFLKRAQLIKDYHLTSIKERKFPVLFFAFLSLFLGKLLLRANTIDVLAFSFYGCALSLITIYFLFMKNIKTSLHALGISGLIGFVIVISIHYELNLLLLLSFMFILFGLIATSRLKLKAHNLNEVYIGFFLGVFSQILIYFFFTFYKI